MASFRTYGVSEEATVYTPLPAGGPLPVKVLGLGRERRVRADYRWNNRRHSPSRGHVFQLTRSGRGVFNGAPMLPGLTFVASWNRPYEYACEPGAVWEFDWLMLEGTFADEVARALGGRAWLETSPTAADRLADQLAQLTDGLAVDRWALSSFAYAFLTDLLRDSSTPAGPAGTRQIAERWVAAHWADATPRALASRFGYSDKYFIGWFRGQVGLSPREFLEETRLRRAAVLLSGTSRSVRDIAAGLGYPQDTYFCKVFRRRFGQSPGEYRAAHPAVLVSDEVLRV